MPRAQTLLRALRGTAPILCAAPEEERAACAARCGALLLRGEGTELGWNGLRLRLFGKDGDCALAPAQGGGPTIVLRPDGPSLAGFVSWTLHSEGASRIE
ncbi:MAG: hypothetical protein K6G17_09880 [Oscillospiraceae bacterium]|nr:hypothetical protein [Oscillospiraceae bacterium]